MEFETKEMAAEAVKTLNGSKFKGRDITVELSMPKLKYDKKIQNLMENTNMDKQASIQARTKFITGKDQPKSK